MALGFNVIVQKTTFSKEFNKIVNGTSQKSQILAEMKKAYEKSTIAQVMFDKWITENPAKTIEIIYRANDFSAEDFAGKLFIDLDFIKGRNYINEYGEAMPYLLVQALTHEFGHALKGLVDPPTFSDQLIDYKGTLVPFVNTIWKQLGFEPMSSYFATAKSSLQQVGYQYTNYSKIDNAVNVESANAPEDPTKKVILDWNTSKLSNSLSKDLLIGGFNGNVLESGGGDDFLFGGAGNDTLDGGDGTDTAVYIGKCSDYKIWEDSPFGGIFGRQWKVENKNGKYPGIDTLKNIERIQFDNNEVYELKPGGLKCQKNITFVIDKTTNTFVFDDIEVNRLASVTTVLSQVEYTKSVVSSLIDQIFADENSDVEIGIVGFNDTKIGNPSQVILPFTTQDNFADRKAAAFAAISSITASDGGDIPETPFDGLKLALNGAIGEWRISAGTRQIFLFTDAPAKDYELAAEVTALAQNVGATITGRSAAALTGGSVNTFNLAFSSKTANFSGLTGSTDPNVTPVSISQMAAAEPIDPTPTTAQVQIFTIYTGKSGTDTGALAKIASDNGGAFLAGLSSEDLVKRLVEIVNPLPTTQPLISITNVVQTEGNNSTPLTASSSTINYGFDITLSKSSTETVTVKYTTADGTATAVSDYTAATGTVTFNPGEISKTVNISVKGDTTLELDETFTVNLTDAVGGTISKATGTGTIIRKLGKNLPVHGDFLGANAVKQSAL